MPRARLLAFQVLLPLGSVLLALALLEIALALFFPVPHVSEWNMYFEPDPFTGYRLKPSSVGRFQHGIRARTNALGLRNRPVRVPKPDGVFRIVVIGDSFTEGANVRQRAAYPQVLGRMLRERCGAQVEVVNAGVGGWSPFEYAQYHAHYGRALEPDLVVVGFYVGNDTFEAGASVEQSATAVGGKRVSRRAAAESTLGLRLWLYDHLHLARLLFSPGPVLRIVDRAGCDEFDDGLLAAQRLGLSAHLAPPDFEAARTAGSLAQLRRLRDDTAGDGARLVVALLPDEPQLNAALQAALVPAAERSRYDFAMPQAFLRPALAAEGISTIDLLPAFATDARCLYLNDTHWTAAGQRLAARTIAEALAPSIPGCGSGSSAPVPVRPAARAARRRGDAGRRRRPPAPSPPRRP